MKKTLVSVSLCMALMASNFGIAYAQDVPVDISSEATTEDTTTEDTTTEDTTTEDTTTEDTTTEDTTTEDTTTEDITTEDTTTEDITTEDTTTEEATTEDSTEEDNEEETDEVVDEVIAGFSSDGKNVIIGLKQPSDDVQEISSMLETYIRSRIILPEGYSYDGIKVNLNQDDISKLELVVPHNTDSELDKVYNLNLVFEEPEVTPDDIISIIASDKEQAVFNMYTPTTSEDAVDCIELYIKSLGECPGFVDVGVTMEEESPSKCEVVFYSEYNGFDVEYPLEITYKEPVKNEYIDDIMSEIRSGEADDYNSYYVAEDLKLINYLVNSTNVMEYTYSVDNTNMLYRLTGLMDDIYGSDIKLVQIYRTGNDGNTYTYGYGLLGIFYKGALYGTKQTGVYTKNILYVPEDTEETPEAYAKAAQDRVNAYLKDDSLVNITYLGEADDYYKTLPICDETHDKIYEVSIAGQKDKLWFFIEKAEDEKLTYPVYHGYNIEYGIDISGDDIKIPFDATVDAKVLDKDIESLVDSENYKIFDISLYSNKKGEAITNAETGKFVVKMPIPEELKEKELAVYNIADNVADEYEAAIEEGYIVIKTDKLGEYAIVEKLQKEESISVSYSTHIQTISWQEEKKDGAMAGTSGQAKRLEAIKIDIPDNPNLNIQYTTHCQSYGWLPWSCNGEVNGTSGESKRLEAIMIRLTGADAKKYDVYYRVHAQTFGWLGWAKNGAPSGTSGLSKRLEAIQIVILPTGTIPPIDFAGVDASKEVHDASTYIKTTSANKVVIPGYSSNPNVIYKTHVQKDGWQGWKLNGECSGTVGQSKRLEGINIKLSNCTYEGGIEYWTHIQTYGWSQGWKSDGEMAGTSGEAKRLEAIRIRLTGEMAEHYDVYYRVHAQHYGWMAWAKNGEDAGTSGQGYRLEGIQIVLVEKDGPAPSISYDGIKQNCDQRYISK